MGLLSFLGLQKIKNSSPSTANTKSNFQYDTSIIYGPAYPIIDKKWDGEKTLGELGVVIKSIPDFERLRLRSYNAYATIDTIKIIASKFFFWTIGEGLKLQSEPNRKVLESEGIINTETEYKDFQELCESRFWLYANSKEMDYMKEETLHEKAMGSFQMEFLGGDFLVICRFDDAGLTVQTISGEHLKNPPMDSGDYYANAKSAGNYIECGIELDKKGSHVAYYVNVKLPDGTIKSERISAFGAKSKKRLAWLVAGNKLSPDHLRSVPEMSQSLEKINKLDRYTEASVIKEEQSAKIVFTIEHEEFSDGSNPLMEKVKRVKSGNSIAPVEDAEKGYVLADGLANKIAETTGGMTYNLTQGASLKSHKADNASSYKEFSETIFQSISAGVNVPPEVAMQQYNSNYSASRAAINSFGYIIDIKREKFVISFYKPIYELWLEHQILSRKIIAKGYLENIDNFMVTKSYSQCRFLGKNMPHIDPLKEAKAIELMLQLDLISNTQAAEALGVGDWQSNFMVLKEERKISPKVEKTTGNAITPLKTSKKKEEVSPKKKIIRNDNANK
jgi:hypothetical protein